MKLHKVKIIKGQIKVITGLHIGASKETIEIGGLDNPIMKHPLTYEPYIPGSSLKGKLRSLIEIKEGKLTPDGNPCRCGKKLCSVCPVFGTSADRKSKEIDKDLGVTRILVRDAHLSKIWHDRFDKGELPMEIKYENTINRISGTATNPRPLERVPAGVEFNFNISFKVFDGDPPSYFETLRIAMCLLELDALGGSGSRGCGQIEFANIIIIEDGIEKQDDNFVKSAKCS